MARDSLGRTSGQIVSSTENGSSKTYTYDKAGRLTAATLGSNSWSYGFGATPGGQCTGTAGTNYNASRESDKRTESINKDELWGYSQVIWSL